MDRRDFFKSIFLSPLLAPLLMASKRSSGDSEFYLISDSPHLCLPPLLKELKSQGLVSGGSYSFRSPVLQQEQLSRTLASSGWTPVSDGAPAYMTLGSSRLLCPARPSFTLAGEGKIWDIRTRTLRSLWTKMNRLAQSSWLTTGSFHPRPAERGSGEAVSLYKDGQKVKTVSLGQDSIHSFRTKDGRITVCVKGGKVRVEESSCRHKICVLCPPVSFAGERIICAPNRFMLEVDGPSSVDTIIG